MSQNNALLFFKCYTKWLGASADAAFGVMFCAKNIFLTMMVRQGTIPRIDDDGGGAMLKTKTPQLLQSERCAELEEIAVELGVSRQRVQQILCRAMTKFRIGLERRGYRFEDFTGTMMVRD